jgi:DnaJ-class molecular chaperone
MKDYYTILGIKITATNDEVKKAYRMMSKKYHPDINPKGAEQFKNINEANSVLSNINLRKDYDIKHKANFGAYQTGTSAKANEKNNTVKSNHSFTSNSYTQSTIIVNGVKINVSGNNTYTSVTVKNGKIIVETKSK